MSWEIGNAFSAMFKRQRISLSAARVGLQIYQSIPIRFVSIDLVEALALAAANNIYGYDAYFLASAIQYAVPLLTLDNGLKHAASNIGVSLMEV